MNEQKIQSMLKNCEAENNIKIIFACESGSRLWRIASKDSDFDVRFVFKRDFREYLKLNKPKDVISFTVEENDFEGFDIYKFCVLLKNSNPSIIEWLNSDMLYQGEQPPELVKIAKEWFSPLALYQHYRSMCKQNYLSYLKSGIKVTYKKYLYAMRGLCNAKYVLNFEKIPPIEFDFCLKELYVKKIISKEIFDKLVDIIEKKKESKENDLIKNIVKIDEYIESFLKDAQAPQPKKSVYLIKELNEYVLRELGV